MTIHVYPLIRRIKQQWIEPLAEGAKKHGWSTVLYEQRLDAVKEGDILVTWNRHADQDVPARQVEDRGGKVICLENPYLKMEDKDWVSVGLGFHNNIKYAPKCLDNGERFKSFNKEIKPWRQTGKHILFPTQSKQFNQRGLGWREYASPAGCDNMLLSRIRKNTERKIIFRIHPNSEDMTAIRNRLGKGIEVTNVSYDRTPMSDDLNNAWATVVWTSNSATDSLMNGVPVFVCGPGVYMSELCGADLKEIEQPKLLDARQTLFNRMAWAQYSMDEVKSGFMFDSIWK